MRSALLLVALAILLLSPAAPAQPMPAPSFMMDVQVPTEAQQPGNRTPITVHVVRICPNAAMVLEQQELTLAFVAPDGAEVFGPMQALFPQQVCAQQSRADQVLPFVVLLPGAPAATGNGTGNETGNATGNATGRAEVLPFTVRITPGPAGPFTYGGPEQMATFAIGVDWPEPAVAAEPVEQAMPSLAFASVGLGLLAAAFAARRT